MRVSFQLVFGDHDLVLPLSLDGTAEERLIELIAITKPSGNERADLARRISDAISTLLDCPIPPTENQVKYAVAIARELSVTLPPEVLQSRSSMGTFLTTYAQAYRQRRGRS